MADQPPGTEAPGEGRGFVYVLSNRFIPGLLKIGVTTGPVTIGAADLFTTGVPFPFEIELFATAESPQRIEKAIHRRLVRARCHVSREFFRLSTAEAEKALRSILGETQEIKQVKFEPYREMIQCAAAVPAKRRPWWKWWA